MQSPEGDLWINAISEESQTLEDAQTYERSNHVPCRPLPSRVILKLERDDKGPLPDRFQGKLVVRGNMNREEELSYADKYAPLAGFEVVGLILALPLSLGWAMHQLYIKGAFLYAKLPLGCRFGSSFPNIRGVAVADGSIVRLLQSLYVLHQAPCLWYEALAKRLSSIGSHMFKSSESMSRLITEENIVILLAFVDDLLLFGEESAIKDVKAV